MRLAPRSPAQTNNARTTIQATKPAENVKIVRLFNVFSLQSAKSPTVYSSKHGLCKDSTRMVRLTARQERGSVLHFLIRSVGTTHDLVEGATVVVLDLLEEHAVELVIGHPTFFDGRDLVW